MSDSIGVAVIGAGMAGRAHAAAYRAASTLYDPVLPEIRLVSIGDVNPVFGEAAARRFGFERTDQNWQAIAEADDIDVVSVVIANHLHREVVEGLLAAGKHVLCEKPLSDTIADAEAMADAARTASSVARVGFTFRRAPGIAFVRDLVQSGELGEILHFRGRYWADYSCDPMAPITWRYKGPMGSGALADVGSHLSYIAEFIAGEVIEVSGGRFSTVINERPVPLEATVGHGHVAVSDTFEPVENDDYAAFTAGFANGASGSIEVSRVAAGHPNGLAFEVFGTKGTASWNQERPSEISLFKTEGEPSQRGERQVILGPNHPYVAGGFPMDAPGIGFGQNDGFVFQARSFLEEVAGMPEGDSLPRCATFDEGIHSMRMLEAVAESARNAGAAVRVEKEN
ncbi:Gfo/Idh/MocA family protein [Paramicrobacterium fandaimingii]|uniref:Gfo/Idh/MocA family protein n=1 Tax=Paramicrobacterium fandaimingii TaxID=2708079 RepID=UPI00141FEE3F|nr:Gfo/Idh/MocA family oxidoreductase [Microbacterium fandaimingii]